MQSIFGKRVWRNLKEHSIRYLTLSFLIVLGIYLIVSIVGSAETVITGVRQRAEQNHVEDGEFSVFLPLTENQIHMMNEFGVELEKHFYLDFTQKDGSTLRLTSTREAIDLIDLDEGRIALSEDEVVLERRYCQEHNLSVGDKIILGKIELLIVGIGVVPDYDAMLKKLSDSSVDSKMFGLAFVSKKQYETMRKTGIGSQSEEYLYAYRRYSEVTDQEIKEKLQGMKISDQEVEDIYFQAYWKQRTKQNNDLLEGIQSLVNTSDKLASSLNYLSEENSELQKGSATIFSSYLKEVQDELHSLGMEVELNENNYPQILKSLTEKATNKTMKQQLISSLQAMNSLNQYRNGIISYTEAVTQIAQGSGKLSEGMKEFNHSANALVNTYFDSKLSNLTMFLKAEDNPRIGASVDDLSINKLTGLVAGVIVMILLTYVISVFVIHEIEQESTVIGALYSLGVKKRDLIIHYLMMPVIVTALASIAGLALGFSPWGVKHQLKDTYDYYSIPMLQLFHPAYLIIYALVMPVVVTIAVNLIVIQKRLSLPALKLIHKEQKNSRLNNVNLNKFGYIGSFRIRQMLKELRTGITVIAAMFLSLLIMMIGIDCYVMCKHISVENKKDTRFEYMYTYKYPDKKVPIGGEAAYVKNLKKEIYSNNIDISLLGIDKHNPYFDVDIKNGKNKVVLSSAMANKFHLSVGDSLILTDPEEDMDYAFQITGITQYSVGMYAFMNINSMRELFGEEDTYNVVFAEKALDINAGKLYAVTSRKDISDSSDVFVNLMMPLVRTMLGVSFIIFTVVLYLMMRVMIERSSYSISLVKIFGYKKNEIRKLYLDGNFYIIALGAAFSIPISKYVIDKIYPLFVSNVACNMNLSFSWQLYLGIYLTIILLYFIINQLLVGKIEKLQPATVLKNRE